MKVDINRNVLSLFSSAGIGELGIKACGFDILLSNELLQERCKLYKENYPETISLCGDIWSLQDRIISTWKSLKKRNPFMIYATPPCQGMSFNGIGKLQSEIRAGRRPKEDARNRLIIPTINIIKALRPQWVLLENVPTMQNTIIRTEDDDYINIIDYIKQELAPDYEGIPEVVNCADYGIPQTRCRLITVLTRSTKGKSYFRKHKSLLPEKTHSESPKGKLKKWLTLKDAIGNMPFLKSQKGKNQDPDLKWHIVPVMKPEKLWWVENTPYNETAYNNQCTECGCQTTPRHGMCFIEGRHQSKKDTPIFCEKCGALLPRPTMIDKVTGVRRMIKGFDSAYRRMVWEAPSPTLTQNFQFESSDKKLHPEQDRVLSILEALILQSISKYNYNFSIEGSDITRAMCCEVIGESVPPYLIELICKNIDEIENGTKE